MKRRDALLRVAGTLLLPAFVSRAMAQSIEAAQRDLNEALGRARAERRPLLVMVIPANTEEAWTRGSALGAFLNHGPEEAIAALGTVELVCMRVAELARVIPNVGSAEPLLLLIDPAQTPAQVTAFDAALPVLGHPSVDPFDDRDAFERARAVEDAHFDAVIAVVGGQVIRALGARLRGLSPTQRADALTRARGVIQHRIPGSYWMTQGGCGADIEEPPPPAPGEVVMGYDCGMGPHADAGTALPELLRAAPGSLNMPIPMGFVLQPDATHLRLSKPLLDRADYLELAPETMWRPGPQGVLVPNDFADVFFDALDGRRCVAHGVGISLGEPGGAETPRRKRWLDAMKRDHERFHFAWWTDHFGATSLSGENITLPVPIPHSALVHVQRTLDAMATVVPDVGVENSALYFTFGEPGAEVFTLREASNAPHRWLLLDLHNLLVNAHAQGFDARAYLAALDLTRVIEIHIAGGKPSDPRWLASGRSFQLDGHDEDIPEEVWTLLREVLPRCTNLRGVTHERMEGTLLGEHDVMRVADELDRLRGVLRAAESEAHVAWPEPLHPRLDDVPYTDAFLQSYVAQLRGEPLSMVEEPARDAFQLSALLVAKLRFERTQRGHPQLLRFFDEDPRGFTEAFRAFHAATPMHAYSQTEEAEALLRFVVSRRA